MIGLRKGLELLAPAPKPSGARRGAARPPGARNRTTREISEFLRGKYGDAIEVAYRFVMRPVLTDESELRRLADHLKCTRLEAAQFYAHLLEKTLPYVYSRLAQIEVRPPGAVSPGLPLFEIDGALRSRLARRHPCRQSTSTCTRN